MSEDYDRLKKQKDDILAKQKQEVAMTAELLSSVLCNTEESGLFRDPETAKKVASFITNYYVVIAR